MMTDSRREQVKALFQRAIELPLEQRQRFLDQACGPDNELRAEVESLLACDQDETASILQVPAFRPKGVDGLPAAGVVSEPGDLPRCIGRYRVIRVLGTGGMGTVFEAEQDRPRRQVALKVMRPGLATREMIRRFELEAHLLGQLQHPGIAQVFEAGTADTGKGPQPFLTMDLIRGQPLTKHAAAHRLDVRQRLELIAKICDAVHYAHQKGVIHRDLKPGNILVDDSGQPKILDFGVARATDADVRTTTLQTDVGQLIGTLAYMSPEQVAGNSRDLDTRSDVYALGVLCFELLTGRLPHDLADKTIPESARAIAEQDPTTLSSIDRVFRGDLDTIAAKALEKDRTRRYQSAAELAADIRHYLANEPISARPATTLYQLRKFARRNKALVTAVCVAFVLLSGGLIQVTLERNHARRAERAAEDGRAEAERQAAIAKAVNDFLNHDLLAAVSPEKLGRDVTMRQVLDHAAEIVEERFADEPLIEAAIRATLGETYHRLGEHEPATAHLKRALALRRANLGEEHADTLASMNDLAIIYGNQGRWDEAETLLVATLAGRRRLLGAMDIDTLVSMSNLGALYFRQARFEQAEPLLVEALEGLLRQHGPDDPFTLQPMNNLANLYARQGRHDEAEPLLIKTLEAKRRTLGEEHPRTLVSLNNLASFYVIQDRYDEAEPLYARTLEARRRVLGEEHPRTLSSLGALGNVYTKLGRYDDAEPLLVAALEGQRRRLGDEHRLVLLRASYLAALYRYQGRYDEAEQLYDTTLATSRRVLGEEHADTLSLVNGMAAVHDKQDRLSEAEPLYREAFEARRRTLGIDHRGTLLSLHGWATTLAKLKKFEDAEPLARECYEHRRNVLGDAHEETQNTVELLADLYGGWGKPDQAAAWRAKLPPTRPASKPADHAAGHEDP